MLPALTALMYDSAGGAWPITGDGAGEIILAYSQDWGGVYNGTHYPNNVALAMAKHPKAWAVQISSVPPGQVGVDVYDVEPGCLSPQQAAECCRQDVEQGRRPTIYANADEAGFDFEACNEALAPYGLALGLDHRVDFLLAHPDGVAEVPLNYVGKQFRFGAAFDTSIVRTRWAALRKGDPAIT